MLLLINFLKWLGFIYFSEIFFKMLSEFFSKHLTPPPPPLFCIQHTVWVVLYFNHLIKYYRGLEHTAFRPWFLYCPRAAAIAFRNVHLMHSLIQYQLSYVVFHTVAENGNSETYIFYSIVQYCTLYSVGTVYVYNDWRSINLI